MTEQEKKQAPAGLRWFVLALISLAMFGNYYIYDSISPLADLLSSQLGFSDSQIGLLQAIYSFPNVIMVLIGGMIIDRIGTRKASLLFSFLVMLGAIITALKGNIILMAIGRLIFGLGAESMIVGITTVIAVWFKGKELSFAFGLNLTIARLGSFLALNSPTIAKSLYNYWQSPLIISAAAGILAVIFLTIFYVIDSSARKKYILQAEGGQDKINFSDIFNFSSTRVLVFVSVIVSILYFVTPRINQFSIDLELQALLFIMILAVTFLRYKSFSPSFWYIVLLCVTFYSAMFPFQTFAVKFFIEAHGTTRETGGALSSILTFSAMFFTPLFGLLADRIGKRSILMMIGSMLIIPVYLLMAYKVNILGFTGLSNLFGVPLHLIIPMSIMGLAFSLVPAVMWPSVAIVVESSKLGTAYGLMTMIQNIGLTLFNLLIGFANDAANASAENPTGYNPGMWIFSILGFLGLFFAFMLRKNETGLNAHGLEKGSLNKK